MTRSTLRHIVEGGLGPQALVFDSESEDGGCTRTAARGARVTAHVSGWLAHSTQLQICSIALNCKDVTFSFRHCWHRARRRQQCLKLNVTSLQLSAVLQIAKM